GATLRRRQRRAHLARLRIAGLPSVDVVCIPELLIDPHGASLPNLDQEVAWLRRMHAGGAMVATACSGALLLAEAGLLDGYEATTHWAFCNLLAQRYPL